MVGFLDAILGIGPSNVASTRQHQAQSNLAAANAIGAAAQGVGGNPLQARRQAQEIFVNQQAQADAQQQQFKFQEDEAKRARIQKAFGTGLQAISSTGGFLSATDNNNNNNTPRFAPGGDSVAINPPLPETADRLTAPTPTGVTNTTQVPQQQPIQNTANNLTAPTTTVTTPTTTTTQGAGNLTAPRLGVAEPPGLGVAEPPQQVSGFLNANNNNNNAPGQSTSLNPSVPNNGGAIAPNSSTPNPQSNFLTAVNGIAGEELNLTGNRNADAALGIADNILSAIYGA